jgi:hypothetical protein
LQKTRQASSRSEDAHKATVSGDERAADVVGDDDALDALLSTPRASFAA